MIVFHKFRSCFFSILYMEGVLVIHHHYYNHTYNRICWVQSSFSWDCFHSPLGCHSGSSFFITCMCFLQIFNRMKWHLHNFVQVSTKIYDQQFISTSSYFLLITSFFIFGYCFLRNPIVHFMVSGQFSNVCFMSSLSKCNGHVPFTIFFLISFSFHVSANIHAIPCLSLLGHHCVYDFLPIYNSCFSTEVINYSPKFLPEECGAVQ